MKKKFFMVVVMLLVGIIGMPTVSAAYDGSSMGTVTEYSGKDSVGSSDVSDVVNSSDPKNVVITYKALDLKEIDKDADTLHRGVDAAWVGFHMELPTSAELATTKVKFNDGSYEAADPDGNYYTGILATKLQEAYESGQQIKVVYYFSYDGDETPEQTVTIIIDPAKVTFVPKDSDEASFDGPKLEAEKQAAANTPATPAEKAEENPETSDINIYALLGLILVSGCGLAVITKKRYN